MRRARVIVGSLCTGYDGLGIALGVTQGAASTAWHSEIEPAAVKLLAHRFPGVPNLGDLKTVDWSRVQPIDLLTAGFPCQPFSLAGARLGQEDPRHLWPFITEAIGILRPRYVLLENVRGLLTAKADQLEPNDRCVCGWPIRRRGLYRGDSIAPGLGNPVPDGHGGEGVATTSPDADRLWRSRSDAPSCHPTLGRSLDVGAERGRSGGLPGSHPASPSDQASGSLGGPSDREGSPRREGPLDAGGVGSVFGPLRGDQGGESSWAEGSTAGDDCPSCGRSVDDRESRSVFRRAPDSVLGALAGMGYDARWGIVRASDAGAPHQRARLFILAHTADANSVGGDGSRERRARGWQESEDRGDVAADADHAARDGQRPRPEPRQGGQATAALKLFPTPTATDYKGNRQSPNRIRDGRLRTEGDFALTDAVTKLLPTPTAGQYGTNQSGTPGAAVRPSLTTLAIHGQDWAQYEPAIRRWEAVVGRPAPSPTEAGVRTARRLAAPFAEWMMGLPEGWVTSEDIGLTRTQQLKAIGNGVVPQQAYLALKLLAEMQ